VPTAALVVGTANLAGLDPRRACPGDNPSLFKNSSAVSEQELTKTMLRMKRKAHAE
jgi:hypothetical protein